MSQEEADKFECNSLLDLLENVVIPMYYDNPAQWLKVMKTSMSGVVPEFGSGRMAREYYEKMYLT